MKSKTRSYVLIALSLLLLCTFATGCAESKEDSGNGEKTSVELSYDDGISEPGDSPWADDAGGEIGVVFTSPGYPATIKSIKYYITSAGIPTTQFKVNIYSLNQDGTPDTSILSSTVTGQATSGDTWVEIDMTSYNVEVSSDFLISMEWLTAPNVIDGSNAQFLGVDIVDPDTRSLWKFPGDNWIPTADVGSAGDRDAMIRTTVEY